MAITKKKYIVGFLVLVVLTASVYVLLPDKVRIDVEKTKTIFKVYENGSWVVGGVEYVNLFDGTKKMRAWDRNITYDINGNITSIYRDAYYKENISTHEIYIFDGSSEDVELYPISHIFRS